MEKYIALSVKCPHCGKSLMNPYFTIHNKPSVKLDIEVKGARGTVNLCAYYGCVDHSSTLSITEGEIYKFFCPHCAQELISSHQCRDCEAPMIPFSMEKGGLLHMCARRGCNSHYLNFLNVSDALRKMYNEFGYF
jgi:predicted RNA-binding Zn-ribbon protein involved in translation (DUF1610 family)